MARLWLAPEDTGAKNLPFCFFFLIRRSYLSDAAKVDSSYLAHSHSLSREKKSTHRISADMTGRACRKRRPNLTYARFSESGWCSKFRRDWLGAPLLGAVLPPPIWGVVSQSVSQRSVSQPFLKNKKIRNLTENKKTRKATPTPTQTKN